MHTIFFVIFNLLNNKGLNSTIQSFSTSQGINWPFIPPMSPHFGGLWENDIKSLKYHFVASFVITFEELYTVLTQVEAYLNSQPLFAVPSNSMDAEPHTPGHFPICSPIRSIPDPDFTEFPSTHLGRCQLL